MSCSQRESPVLSSPMLASHRKKMKLLFEKMHTAWWSKPRIYTEMGYLFGKYSFCILTDPTVFRIKP